MMRAEGPLGLRPFSRRRGRYPPTVEAARILGGVRDVLHKKGELQYSIEPR
jgi:hypothetical protein